METSRILIGLFIAIALPDGIPRCRHSFIFRGLVSAAYGLWITLPVLQVWKSLVLVLLVSFLSCCLQIAEGLHEKTISTERMFGIRSYLKLLSKERGRESETIRAWLARSTSSGDRRSAVSIMAFMTLSVALLCSSINFDHAVRVFLSVTRSDEYAIVVSGLLGAAIASHEIVARIYARFDENAPRVRSEIFSFKEAYGYIGWLERALIYAFVASGQAAAAALAMAAKSLARYPQAENDPKFSDRFIIGTFVSVLFAVLWSVIVRLALGLSPM